VLLVGPVDAQKCSEVFVVLHPGLLSRYSGAGTCELGYAKAI
jgi:hypothetical protein